MDFSLFDFPPTCERVDPLTRVLECLKKNSLEYKLSEKKRPKFDNDDDFFNTELPSDENDEDEMMDVSMEDKATLTEDIEENLKQTVIRTCLSAELNETNKLSSYDRMKLNLRSLIPTQSARERYLNDLYVLVQCKTIVLISLLMCLLLILFWEPNYKHSTIFTNVTSDLEKHVYGQDRVVRELDEYLKLDKPHLKVIALVGGIGVGKSYTLEIMKANYPYRYRVQTYYSPIRVTLNDISLPFFYPRMISLENLRECDLNDVAHFLKTRDSVAEDQYITVFAVFNLERVDESLQREMNLKESAKTIRDFFVREHIDAKVIAYDFLSEDVISKCIVDAINDSGLTLTATQIDIIKENSLRDNIGCKGIYGKVQVLGRQ